MKMNKQKKQNNGADQRIVFRLGGMAAVLLTVYSIVTMIAMVILGGIPGTAGEAFRILQEDRLAGLIRLDLLTVIAMPLYYLLYAGLCALAWKAGRTHAVLAAALVGIGVTLVLATPSAAAMVHLADRYAAAATEAQRDLYLAAGEAVLASDMWHGTGALLGGLLIPSAGVVISAVLPRRTVSGKWAAYVGILTNGLDLIRIGIGFFSPAAAIAVMAVAGPLYLLWFPLVARILFQTGRTAGGPE
jgi:hypothetical protein